MVAWCRCGALTYWGLCRDPHDGACEQHLVTEMTVCMASQLGSSTGESAMSVGHANHVDAEVGRGRGSAPVYGKETRALGQESSRGRHGRRRATVARTREE